MLVYGEQDLYRENRVPGFGGQVSGEILSKQQLPWGSLVLDRINRIYRIYRSYQLPITCKPGSGAEKTP